MWIAWNIKHIGEDVTKGKKGSWRKYSNLTNNMNISFKIAPKKLKPTTFLTILMNLEEKFCKLSHLY